MENRNKLYLLRMLSSLDYEDLISQIELSQNGYETYFIIDADLFGNYCFPFGIIPEETRSERYQKLTSEYLSDEQLTLHTIFHINETHKKILLLDEYFFEIEGMLYKARREGDEKLRNLTQNLSLFNFSTGNDDNVKEVFYSYFSKIYSKVLFHINGLEKAHKILKEKRILLDSDEIGNSTVQDIIEVNRGDDKNIIKIEELMLFALNQHKKNEIRELFGSRKRDAIILDRLLTFNKSVAQKEKVVFILLSDSSLLKATLSNIQSGSSGIDYPTIAKKKISYYRNIPQTFAFLISISYNEDKTVDYKKTIQNIRNLQKSSQSLNHQFNIASKELNVDTYELLTSVIFERFNNLRNAFENAGILKSFDQLHLSIKDELKNQSLNDIKILFEKFKKESGKFLSEVITDQIRFLELLRKAGEFNSVFVSGINKIKQGIPFDISKGSDYIEGNHQHLPILLTFSTSHNRFLESLCALVKLVLSRRSDGSAQLIEQLERIIKEMNSSNIFEKDDTEINLIKALIFMILPSKSENNNKVNDITAKKWLDNLKINDNNESKANLFYLKIWNKRRIKEYNDSIKIAKEAIKQYDDDPRFYHGLFMSEYCHYEEIPDKTSANTLILIEDMLKNLVLAKTLYPKFIMNHFHSKCVSPIILDAMNDSFYNSYSYCLTLKADFIKNKFGYDSEYSTLIEKALTFFDRLKDSSGILKDKLPEYYDTEAFLLYHYSFCESLENREKILYKALGSIIEAQVLSRNFSLMEKYQSRENLIRARLRDL